MRKEVGTGYMDKKISLYFHKYSSLRNYNIKLVDLSKKQYAKLQRVYMKRIV